MTDIIIQRRSFGRNLYLYVVEVNGSECAKHHSVRDAERDAAVIMRALIAAGVSARVEEKPQD